MELIRLENVHKTYHLGEVEVPVLRGISLSIRRGEMVALMPHDCIGAAVDNLMFALGLDANPRLGELVHPQHPNDSWATGHPGPRGTQ